MGEERRKPRHAYVIMLIVYAIFFIFAFLIDTPKEIAVGLWKIMTCRGVLLTDYMEVGGVGATLVNSAIVGGFSILTLMRLKVRPNGSTIMALWLSTGFAMFGKNIFNLLPLTFGVWLYSKVKKEPFVNFTLVTLLSATLSPVVSGIAFHPDLYRPFGIALGIAIGIAAGFIFPPVSAFTVRAHSGYDLYNMGFAGGLISTFIVSAFESVGVEMQPELEWSTGNQLPLSILLYIISAGLIMRGLFPHGKFVKPDYDRMLRHSGRIVSDYLVMFGYSVYFNMGVLCAFSTTLTLLLGGDLNGPTLCGIFTITGFGAFGKHMRNVIPVICGAVICTYINRWDITAPSNILAILFSTGLAPIAGQFGVVWGIVAGFLHVNTIMHIGFLNSGLNLYNNGYAAGFVTMLLLPVIMAFQKDKARQKKEAIIHGH